ncbi:MAG: CRISPR-associated endonuclease Cas2 [Clostridiaceae bacterium]|nr:CRISPR-associated endonuclease Cas2 [Clostridiaceae bacterium]
MMILITYDVNTADEEGRKRLRNVAKICENYGQRVQNSVFECVVDPSMFIDLKMDLNNVIDQSVDNLRFYLLGKNWQNRVESMGKNVAYDPEKDSFIL